MSSNTEVQPTNFSNSALMSHWVLGNSWNESLLLLVLFEVNNLGFYYVFCSVHLLMYGSFVMVTLTTDL